MFEQKMFMFPISKGKICFSVFRWQENEEDEKFQVNPKPKCRTLKAGLSVHHRSHRPDV